MKKEGCFSQFREYILEIPTEMFSRYGGLVDRQREPSGLTVAKNHQFPKKKPSMFEEKIINF